MAKLQVKVGHAKLVQKPHCKVVQGLETVRHDSKGLEGLKGSDDLQQHTHDPKKHIYPS